MRIVQSQNMRIQDTLESFLTARVLQVRQLIYAGLEDHLQ